METQSRIWTRRHVLATLGAAGIIVLLALVTRLGFPFRYDERDHQNFTRYIADHATLHTIITYEGADYPEAKAPLLFIIGAVYGKAVSFDLWQLRLIVVLFGLGALLANMRLSRCFASNRTPFWAAMVLLPYFLILGVTYMTDVPTLCFLLIAACGYFISIEKQSWGWLSVAALSMSCAAYIRIDSFFLIGAVGLACLLHRRLTLPMTIALAVPVIVRLPLVIAWGGLAAPPAQVRSIAVETGFHAAHFSFLLSALGFYFWPFALESFRDHRVRLLIAAGMTIAGSFFLPRFTDEVDFYGGLMRSFARASHAPLWMVNAGLIGSMFLGSLILLKTLLDGERRNPTWLALRLTCIIGILMQVVRGGVIYERYLLQVSPFLLGLLVMTSRSTLVIWIWLAYAAAMLLAHLLQHGVL